MGSEKASPTPGEPLLQTKLFIPAPRDDLIPRLRLTERLEADLYRGEAFGRKLTLIAAPAGYGKTTLACQWLAAAEEPFAWLALDPGDNDYIRFLTYLLAAIDKGAPGVGGSVRGMLTAPQRPPDEVILTVLLNELAAWKAKLTLVLDDYHLIQTSQIHECLNFLVEHTPPNLHLVIISREDPPLPLHRLAARREMIAIRHHDLSFDQGEATAFFRAVGDSELTPDQAASLTRRTEGWVTGLQLAALSMRSTEDREAFIRSFTGSNRYILDYLFEEVFDRQPGHVQSFLLHTAVLNRLSPGLADAVSERSDSGEILAALEHANFFILPLDQSRQWYRYHRLFADLLRHRLGRSGIQTDALHARASRWFERHGYLDEAVDHALLGRHWEAPGALIHQAGDAKLRGGEIATLLSWCKRMPGERLLSDPDWALTYAWVLILVGDLGAGEAVLQSAEQTADAGRDTLLGEIAAAQAFASRARGDFANTIALSKKALSKLPKGNRSARGNVSLNLGLISWHLGRLGEAEAALEEAREDTKATGNHFGYHTAQVFMARSQACRGELSPAADTLERALEMGDQLPTAALAHADLAAIQFERDQLEPARGHMVRALRIAEAMGNIEFQTACCIQDALFRLGMGDIQAAEQALKAAPTYGQPEVLPPLSAARLLSCQVQLALAVGDVEKARSLHARVPTPHDAHTYFRFIDLNSARIHLAAGEREFAAGALEKGIERRLRGDGSTRNTRCVLCRRWLKRAWTKL